jgi:hypothetical protein
LASALDQAAESPSPKNAKERSTARNIVHIWFQYEGLDQGRVNESKEQGGPMSIFKRGNVYWYKFMWNGEMVRESTKRGNQNTARNIESAHRTSLANGLVGIREKKVASTLKEFLRRSFRALGQVHVRKEHARQLAVVPQRDT